jgi:hypothetical protein
VHPRDADWRACAAILPPGVGARQYFKVHIDLVQTSCGYAVPFFDYRQDRVALTRWAEKKGEAGVTEYWADNNQRSLDGRPTGIFD